VFGGHQVGEKTVEEQFVQALTSSQAPLLAYITCLLGDVHDASTVLQETNLTLWRKSDQFPGIRDFLTWSRGVAYFQALAFLRDQKRDKLIFSQEVISLLVAERDEVDFDERRLALRSCVAQLRGKKRELIQKRYSENKAIRLIAKELELSEGAVKMSLRRIRLGLMRCIQHRLGVAG
jgi:RNA polymerase sigma-70 factor (ECF subfamily)